MTLRHSKTAILSSAAMLFAPALASAQFTTFVAPPQKATARPAKPTPAVAKAKADSVSRMTLTDMKTWVDSAAGLGTQVANANDTTLAPADTAKLSTAVPAASPRGTTTFSNGAIAPNTATSLPTILFAGLGFLVAGAFVVLRGRRAPAR